MTNTRHLTTAIALAARKNPEGFTFNIQTLTPQRSGYAVAIAATQGSFGIKGLAHVIRYAVHHKIPCIGGWRDSETGLYYFDATMIVNTLAEAISLGKANSQIAIFDLYTQTEIRL